MFGGMKSRSTNMPKIHSVFSLLEVDHEGDESTKADETWQESKDDFIDLCMEVDEETTSDAVYLDETNNVQIFKDEDSAIEPSVEHLSPIASSVVGGVADGIFNLEDKKENLIEAHLSSVESQKGGAISWANEPDVKVKVEDSISDTEFQPFGAMITMPSLSPPIFIKQEPKAEDEDSDIHGRVEDGSQDQNHVSFLPYNLAVSQHNPLSSNGPVPVCIIKSARAENTCEGEVRGTVKSVPDAMKLLKKVLKNVNPLMGSPMRLRCLVCNVPCTITANRKIPSLPFCKRCKKAYFYKRNRTHTARNDPIIRVCTSGGHCKIDYRRSKYCPNCHHTKFLAVLKAAEKAFKEPLKIRILDKQSHRGVSTCRPQDWSVVRDEILIREAQICQPRVELTRLDRDVLSAYGVPDLQDNNRWMKQEPTVLADPHGQSESNCSQPLNGTNNPSSRNFRVISTLPMEPFHNPSHLNAHPQNCYIRPVVQPNCEQPKAEHVKSITPKKHGGKKQSWRQATVKSLLAQKIGTSEMDMPQLQQSWKQATVKSLLTQRFSASKTDMPQHQQSGTPGMTHERKIKLINTEMSEIKILSVVSNSTEDSWRLFEAQEGHTNLVTQNSSENISIKKRKRGRPAGVAGGIKKRTVSNSTEDSWRLVEAQEGHTNLVTQNSSENSIKKRKRGRPAGVAGGIKKRTVSNSTEDSWRLVEAQEGDTKMVTQNSSENISIKKRERGRPAGVAGGIKKRNTVLNHRKCSETDTFEKKLPKSGINRPSYCNTLINYVLPEKTVNFENIVPKSGINIPSDCNTMINYVLPEKTVTFKKILPKSGFNMPSDANTVINSLLPEPAKDNEITVSIFTCGHACSKCNSQDAKKWLQDQGCAIKRPSSSIKHNRQSVLESGTSSTSALVLQKLHELNELLQGDSRYYFDLNEPLVQNSMTVPTSGPAMQSSLQNLVPVMLQYKSTEQPPVNSAGTVQLPLLSSSPAFIDLSQLPPTSTSRPVELPTTSTALPVQLLCHAFTLSPSRLHSSAFTKMAVPSSVPLVSRENLVQSLHPPHSSAVTATTQSSSFLSTPTISPAQPFLIPVSAFVKTQPSGLLPTPLPSLSKPFLLQIPPPVNDKDQPVLLQSVSAQSPEQQSLDLSLTDVVDLTE